MTSCHAPLHAIFGAREYVPIFPEDVDFALDITSLLFLLFVEKPSKQSFESEPSEYIPAMPIAPAPATVITKASSRTAWQTLGPSVLGDRAAPNIRFGCLVLVLS